MNSEQIMNNYLSGWMKGDLSMIVDSITSDFILEDPEHGIIEASNFEGYFEKLVQKANLTSQSEHHGPFMLLSEIVIEPGNDGFTAWYWWKVAGTPVEGGALVKANENGIFSEKVTYFRQG